jgi:hypothetical protein
VKSMREVVYNISLPLSVGFKLRTTMLVSTKNIKLPSTMKRKFFRILMFIGLCSSACIAQSLPTVQEKIKPLPKSFQIDGRSTEWNNTFSAYNNNVDLNYTIASNDSVLYLIVKATNPNVINKIIGGGITFTLNMLNKKEVAKSVRITYPYLERKNKPYINFGLLPKIDPLIPGTVFKADSMRTALSKKFESKSKYIHVEGLANVDSLLSRYNDVGINAASSFDNLLHYTCEFSVNLKYLLKKKGSQKLQFQYNILLSGTASVKIDDIEGASIVRDASGGIVKFNISPDAVLPDKNSKYATDVWAGAYLEIK